VSIETATKVGLVSKALLLCQETAANSLSDDRYGVEIGANLFELIYENELQSNPWRFSMKKTALSRLNLEPLNQYKYVYQIPADCLLVRHVYPPIDYEIFGAHLYADQPSVELDYQFKPEVASCPAYFQMLMAYALARDMVQPITGSAAAVQIMQGKYVIQRDRALYADSQARPAKRVFSSPFTDVRGA
jgi:hypothetical protein